MKISSVHIVPYLNYAVMRGIPRQKLLDDLRGVDLDDDSATITKSDFENTLVFISSVLKEDKLGLYVGRNLDFNTLGVIYRISLKARTIEEGLYYCHSYLRKTFPYLEINNVVRGTKRHVQLSVRAFSKQNSRVILETTMMVMQRELQLMWDKALTIRCYSPFYDDQYPQDWGAGVDFSLSFDNKVHKRIKDYSGSKLDLLIPAYLKFLEKLQGRKSLTSRTKIAALSLASPALPGVQEVAGQFNCNVRTFQRMLAVEKMNYRNLLDEVKCELSRLLLKHDTFTVSDVSAMLGYSEPAAFVRAFNKWEGTSPLKFRRQTFN
ncbi:MAG TPA: helix-turn-helix transcriptional regulator [Cyclobacteriaceae bacterium]|nr:helix-turn-helix transcriptional regulator [Cyclobacteriaceae bacterium]